MLALEGDAALFEFACQPEATVEADAGREGKPGLQADVAKAKAFVEEVVVQVVATRGFLAGFKEALLVLAQTVRPPGFLTSDQGDASTGAARFAREFERESVFIDRWAVEMPDRHSFPFRLGTRFRPQEVRQLLAMFGKVPAQDVVLVEITVDATRMIEQPRIAAEAQTIEARKNKEYQLMKTG